MDMDNIIILDGGMGHELKLRGVSDGTFLAGVLANEKKNCNNDNDNYVDVVESIHEDYLVAGCDIITTNSFVAVSILFCMFAYAIDYFIMCM